MANTAVTTEETSKAALVEEVYDVNQNLIKQKHNKNAENVDDVSLSTEKSMETNKVTNRSSRSISSRSTESTGSQYYLRSKCACGKRHSGRESSSLEHDSLHHHHQDNLQQTQEPNSQSKKLKRK